MQTHQKKTIWLLLFLTFTSYNVGAQSRKAILNNNGHECVDLGLPSGTLWATCNVGATTPEESGDFYAWGETEAKDNYSWATYKWCDGDVVNKTNQNLTKYCDRGAYGRLDGKISLEPKDDVAHIKWGGNWHIPTIEEYQELMDYCTFDFDWIDEAKTIEGYKITGPNGNVMIMPAAGYRRNDTYNSSSFYYWSANLQMKDIPSNNHATHVFCLRFLNSDEAQMGGNYRYYGYPVRPVLSKYKPVTHTIFGAPSNYLNHDLVDLGLPSGELWATCNMGASSPIEAGCYYAWGEKTGSCEGKTTFNDNTYTTDMTNYTEVGVALDSSDDTATMNWGGKWRMPTSQEINELLNTVYTICEWTTINGVNGIRVTSVVKGFEGNNIFLPAAGIFRNSAIKYADEDAYYWSSTLYSDPNGSYNAGLLYGSDVGNFKYVGNHRYYGLSIRPVVSFDDIVVSDPDPDVVIGDANGDGKVTVADYTAIAHCIMGKAPANFNEKAADVNGDGKINVADYTAAAHLILYGTVEKPK
ncbi:MAG: hypothetical protein IJ698_03050 [Prevotella sp.]|nr:hypothetical protein [Prevotella sp.]